MGAAVSAAPSPPFSELLQRAQTSAPRLTAIAADVAAAEGRARQATAWPNPVLAIERENFSGTGPYRGSAQAQTTVSLTEPLELAGQRNARIRVGRAELDAVRARAAQAVAEFGYELALAYAGAEAGEKRSAILADDLERTVGDVRRATALVDAGREGALRAVQAAAAEAAARADLEAAHADAAASLAQLSSLVGAADAFTAVGPSLLARASSPVRALADEPVAVPLIAAEEASRTAAEQRVQVERKRALPNFGVSVGARRLAGDDASAMVGGVSVSLPLFDRNAGAIAAARAEGAAAGARVQAARLAVAAGWHGARAQAQAAVARLAAAVEGEAAAREAYRLAQIAYDAGRAPLLELSATRRSLTEAALRTLDARVARIRAEAEMARLMGRVPFGD